jgi:Type IV secretion-system coupling protein DNA-binding domain
MILPQVIRILFVGAMLSLGGFFLNQGWHWTWLQRRYFTEYLDSIEFQGKGEFAFLFVQYPDGWRMAGDDDVIHETAHFATRDPGLGFAPSPRARSLGAKRLEWRPYTHLDCATAYEWLRQYVYDGNTPWDLIFWPTSPGLLFVAVLIPWTILRGRRARRQSKLGYILRGPRLVTPSEFNRERHSDGIGIQTLEPRKRGGEFLWRNAKLSVVRIPRHEENSHFVLVGDSGSGKTLLIRQKIAQIRARGEIVIVYDPALEFTPQFYDPNTDLILNAIDQRMPFWTPSDEVQYPAEALALAASLFPDKPHENPFFTEAARKIFAYLLRYRPTPQELTRWMKNPDEIDRRIAGTELEAMIPRNAAGQRAAVLATFNQAAAAFQLLPREGEAEGRWSAVRWARQRKGSLFLPSVPTQRESLRPLISMWLDSLFLRLMEFGHKGVPPVWVILDELATLQRLPQLLTLITEGRKANVRLVLGLQGRSQLQSLYGHQAEAMLSQPMTKIFLRTSEPDAAAWVSRSIGEVEIIRLEQSRTVGLSSLKFQHSRTSHWQRRTEPLVMSSIIAGLHNQTGYLKSRDLVVPLSFPYTPPELKQPALVPRPLPELEPLNDAAAAGIGSGANERSGADSPPDGPQQPQPEQESEQGADAAQEIFE